MRLTLMGPGPHVDLNVSGTTAVVGGQVTIDCAARQCDHQVVIDVRDTNGVLAEGAGNAFVCSFVISPRTYTETESLTETGADDRPLVIRQPVGLTGDAIEARLWTYQNNRSND